MIFGTNEDFSNEEKLPLKNPYIFYISILFLLAEHNMFYFNKTI